METLSPIPVCLGLGGNLGDRVATLQQALALLTEQGITLEKISPVYETDALMPDGAPANWNLPFLNIAVLGKTGLSPYALLDLVKSIERQLGRKPAERWAPREIDIDILLYGDQMVQSRALTIPHPEMARRAFVMQPLADIVPEWPHPALGQPIETLAFFAGNSGLRPFSCTLELPA